jgi:hypothetical protein
MVTVTSAPVTRRVRRHRYSSRPPVLHNRDHDELRPEPGCSARGLLVRGRRERRRRRRAARRPPARPGLVVWRTARRRRVAAPDRCPHREAPLSPGSGRRTGASCARTTAGRSATAGRCVLVPSSARVAGAACGASPDVHVPRALRPRVAVPGEPVAGIPQMVAEDDPAYRRINNRRRGVAHVGHPDDRQLPRHLALPVRARRHVRHRHEPHRPEDRAGAARRRLLRLRVRGGRGQRRGRHRGVRRRRTGGPPRMSTGFNLPFTVRSTIHYEHRLDHMLLLCSTPSTTSPRTSRS